MKELDRDSNGFRHLEFSDGYSVCVMPITPFREYLAGRAWDILSYSDKRKVFLKWKWGCSDEANEALEATRRLIYGRNIDMKDTGKEGWDYMKNHIVEFEKMCYRTMVEVGLVKDKTKEQLEIENMVDRVFK